jgi:hypothetical protein
MVTTEVMEPKVMGPEVTGPAVSDPAGAEPAELTEALAPGTRVEVRNRLDGRWAKGFEVVAAEAGGYRLRRLSDGNELPLLFADDDVRKEKRRSGMWWY